MLFTGIDWSDQSLDYYLQDQQEQVLAQGQVKISLEGLTDMFVHLEKFGRPAEIAIAAETSHGVWIQSFLDRGYQIYPLNPKSVNQFRLALAAQGDKTDKIDRRIIAKFLATFYQRLTPLKPDADEIVALRVACQHRVRLVQEHTAKLQELQCLLKGYYPAVLELFGTLDSQIALAFLCDYPTQDRMQALSAKRLHQWLRRHSYTSMYRFDQMVEALHRPALPVAVHLQQAQVPLIRYLARSLQLLATEIQQRDQQINDHLDGLPEADWIRSLPGAGKVLAPALLACLGRDTQRFASVSKAQAFMGTAPVTQQSGRSCRVHFRRGCWKFARYTLHLFADHSRRHCQWAQQFYEKQRQIGHRHPEALRSLAHKWVKILLAMQRTGCPYNDAIFVNSQHRYLLNQKDSFA